MSNEELIVLAKKIETGTASSQELLLYISACESFQKQMISLDEIDSEVAELQQAGLKKFWAKQNEEKAKVLPIWWCIAAAAVAALVIFGVSLFYYSKKADDVEQFSNVIPSLAPGKNTATLKLGNGKTIQLSDAKTGLVLGSDDLQYNDGTRVESKSVSEEETSQNKDVETLTASTPRGGTYQVTLSDGTHVWLNADSKLLFPSKFTGNSRIVTLVGEGYFEVAHNKAKPFKVRTAGQELEVLGTHFNVNAYTDELSTRTTLLTGSVKVNNNIVLLPGDQAMLSNGVTRVSRVDVDEVVAWKNGFFVFKGSNLGEVMRQLSRWYNLDVDFAGPVPKRTFNGKVYRNMNLNDVLEVLSFSKVKFKITGRRMTIYP
ncbi:FecR protein [Pedobacter steynii]|uniref:FecR protein n=1 Tax=Pedobacter steynii TaxID=430522 RepID=A0A1G9K877_9SPHI|nr:FecR family protein [Pedobacter steynii]NQX38475.1 FecR domain-containing protein [Pedobacter steynii]SDL45839.1 FecR protein [Pedobacter steynii]